MNKEYLTKTSPSFVFFIALICALLWGISFPLVKYSFNILNIQNSTSGKLYFASYRFLVAGLMMFFFIVLSRKTIFLSTKQDYISLAFIGILQTTTLYSFFYIGLSHTTGVKAAMITASGSFFLAILSNFLFKNDPLTFRKIVGLLLGFLGIVLINVENIVLNFDFKLTGEVFILIGTIASALGNVVAKFTVSRICPQLICAYQFTFGSIALFSVSFLNGSPSTLSISGKAVVLILLLAGISAIAFSLWYMLIRYNSLSKIAIYRFLIPICGTFFSTTFIENENLNLLIFLSLLLVCSGIILTSKKNA